MKNFILFYVLLVSVLFSCAKHEKSSIETISAINIEDTVKLESNLSEYELKKVRDAICADSLAATLNPMDKNKFIKMCEFIKAKGFVVPSGNSQYDNYQYTHYDSKGTRHAFIYLVPDNPYDPFTGARITVYAYKNGKRDNNDLNNFVGYQIIEDGPKSVFDDEHFIRDYPWIARGYYELEIISQKM